MVAGSRRANSFTVCIRDEDSKTYEFQTTQDATRILNRVASAVGGGRRVRYYLLASGANACACEAQYLAGKGYSQAIVRL